MPDITTQVHSAISSARATFNGNKEISPSSDRELRQMALDIRDKITALSDAQASVSEFLQHHSAKQATFS